MDLKHDQKNIQGRIDRNEERIASLTAELRESLRSKKSRIECLEKRSKDLEKKIQDLKDENELLKKHLQEMKDENKTLNLRIEMLDVKMNDVNETLNLRIEKLETENKNQKARKQHKDSVLIIGQIDRAIQINMCKYVLREHYKEKTFYEFREIEEYIKVLEHEAQEAARNRLTEIKEKIHWEQRLVNNLKILKQKRIDIAHPDLSSQKIQQATEYLKEENVLSKEMVDDVHKLKKLWETSEELLQTSSTEGQGDQAGLSQDKTLALIH